MEKGSKLTDSGTDWIIYYVKIKIWEINKRKPQFNPGFSFMGKRGAYE